jgi:hypothetical protein
MLERHPDQRQQSRPYAPRRKRPDLFDQPPRSSGNGIRWLAGLIVVVVLAIGLSRLTGTPEPEPVSTDTQPAPPPPPVRTAPPAVPLPPPEPAGAGATPTVDLMVRLEAHRQLVRAGNAVYLDSLLAESDSILRRWPARPREPVLVAVVRDSLADRAGTQGDAALRDAFSQWSQLRLGGLQFSFIQDTAQAQVVVEWIDQFDPEDKRTGQTDLTLGSDGSIQYARMRLALRDPAGRRLDRPAMLTVALHEVGHVLGLGHSASQSDIMFPTPRSPALSERDRRTVELIYGLPAGSVKGGN